MKKYKVEVEFNNKRINSLIIWAETPERAKEIAVKWWRINPDFAKRLTAELEKY